MPLRLGNLTISASGSPLVMGILNVTPDSFSDAGRYLDPKQAADRAAEMVAQGADIIDVGPESTRPGSHEVPASEQIARAIPVIEGIREQNASTTISIDVRLACVAKAALDAGADIINDVSAMRDDPGMVDLIAGSDVPIVLMHRRGNPVDMQQDGGPLYDDVVAEIRAFLSQRVDWAVERGVKRSQIVIDPGIGFGKRVEHNLLILRHLDKFVSLGLPVLVGASRKRFIRPSSGDAARRVESEEAKDKSWPAGSLACAVIATMARASILRVHDVAETLEAVRVCAAIRDAAR